MTGVTAQASTEVRFAIVNFASIPSPGTAVWYLGPIPIRAYALCIVVGIFLAVWITERRLRRQGAEPGTAVDIAVWAVPFGILGARLWHVITDAQLYFGEGREPIQALMIWKGGLGIPGALLGGALGAWIACRVKRIPLSMVADALAVGLPIAQAVGRLGNWFNQELYGRPTDLPWALEIDNPPPEYPEGTTFHPTFLYEALWNLGGAALIWWLDRKFKFGRGRAFALYVIMYSVGRFWVESLRIDPAHTFGGMRLNMWTALIALVGGLAYFLLVRGPRQRLELDSTTGRVRVVDDVPGADEASTTPESASNDAQAATERPADGKSADGKSADEKSGDEPEGATSEDSGADDNSAGTESASDSPAGESDRTTEETATEETATEETATEKGEVSQLKPSR